MPRQRGFTLLEIIIAVGIFAVVSALAYGGLNSILRASQHTQAASQALQRLQLAMSLIHQDLTQVVFRPITNEFGEQEPALFTPQDATLALSFTRRGWKNPANQTRATLQRVAYALEDGQLYRQYWFHLDRAPNEQPIRMPLLKGVSELKLRFLDSQKEWRERWPPLSMTTQPVPLPKAVEITLVTEQWGDIQRLFPL